MVKKRRARGASQAAVFQAAAHEFADRGYDAARVDRIAAKARLNKAMLYYHYGSKQRLYLEILRDMFRAVGARVQAIAASAATADAKLDAWIEAVIEEAAARPWFAPIALREMASGAPHIDPETFRLINGVYLGAREVIAQGQREGAFRLTDPLLTYFTIMPSILIFFVRQRVVAQKKVQGLAAAEPRNVADFTRHMQLSARAMLRKDV